MTRCAKKNFQMTPDENLECAALFGSKAATISCMRKGAQSSIPTAKEVEMF